MRTGGTRAHEQAAARSELASIEALATLRRCCLEVTVAGPSPARGDGVTVLARDRVVCAHAHQAPAADEDHARRDRAPMLRSA